ncbi:MAG: hypothetical protein ABH844_04470 [Candidatus Omnitrophota bacterium]
MDIEPYWEKARKKTEIIRSRVKGLSTFNHTEVPYVFLAESSINKGNTVIRKGKIYVEKPLILLPDDLPQFSGFELESDLNVEQGTMQMFFLMRGIRFPSLKYNNTTESLDLDEDSLSEAVKKYKSRLEKQENVNTALILGPEDCWQFSMILYMAALVSRCVKTDIMNLRDKLNK